MKTTDVPSKVFINKGGQDAHPTIVLSFIIHGFE
jgi:hypothetical protein